MKTSNRQSGQKAAIVISIAGLVAIYTVLVVSGTIPKDSRIDAVHLLLILTTLAAVIIVLRPELFDRVHLLEFQGVKIELLQRLQERQVRQDEEIYDIRLIIPLLFRDIERKHLGNLARGTTGGYRGGSAVREELRRLRSIGLLKSRPDRNVSDLHSETEFDLAEWMELTDLGHRWVRRLQQLDEAVSEKTGKGDSRNG